MIRGRIQSGLGRTPLVKVETSTAPIYTGSPVAPTAPVLTTPTYVPPVTQNKLWEGVNTYLPKVIDIAAPFIAPRNNYSGYQTPTYVPPQQNQVQQNQSQQQPNANFNNNGQIQEHGFIDNINSFIKNNPMIFGAGVIATGLVIYKVVKK